MINDSRISKLLNRVKFTSPTDDKAVQKLFEAQEGGQKYNYVPKSRVGYRPNPDGTESTHIMAREYIPGRGWVVFPTLYQDSNNDWIDMGEIHGVNWWPIYEYAQQVGELYDFGEDEEDAINFADKGAWKENMNKRPFFKTRLSPTDELRFQKFFKTLPENLQTDDDLYDIRGYWDAEGKPDQFDYSQEKQEDGQYHAYSRHPYTGKILKSPAHPTFQDAMENETHKRVDVYGNIYTGLPKMQDAGTVIDKDGFIDIEKSYGINPLSAEGIQLARDLSSEYPNAKFVCTAQGCAQIASDAAEASGYDFSRSNAWDIGNRNTVDYINPVYEDEIGQGQPLSDPDWNREFPQEMFAPGNLIGLNRYNSESSYRYADQEKFPGSRGYEHIGYMLDDNTLLHGTGKTAEHPAYFILDNISDNRIKLPHYGSYEPVESISPAGYMKSIGNFAGDVANYFGFEEGGQLSNHRFQGGGQNQEYLDQLAAYNWGLQEYAKKYYTEGEYTQEMLEQDYQGLAEHPAPWDPSNNIYAVDKEFAEKSGFNKLNAIPCGASYHCAAPAYDTVPVFKKPEKPTDTIPAESSILENKNSESINYRPPRKGLYEVDKSTGRFVKNSREGGGNVSQMGYRDDSPYKDRDFIDIETENGVIDMSRTGETLLATDLETGEQRILEPYSGLHKFVGKTIREEKLPKAQDGGMSFDNLGLNAELVRQRIKRNGDVVSILKRKGPGGEFSRYKIVTRNGEVIKVSEIHGKGGFEDEEYVPYTPDEMYMQQNQFDIRPEPNSENSKNINNFEIKKKNDTRML